MDDIDSILNQLGRNIKLATKPRNTLFSRLSSVSGSFHLVPCSPCVTRSRSRGCPIRCSRHFHRFPFVSPLAFAGCAVGTLIGKPWPSPTPPLPVSAIESLCFWTNSKHLIAKFFFIFNRDNSSYPCTYIRVENCFKKLNF